MFQVTLTAYGQSIVSDLINIDGIILLYEKVTVASLSDISSYTVVHDEEACGNLKNNVGNVFITDLSNNTYLAKSILFYKNDGNQKRVVAGYSADSAVVKKTEQILNVCLSFDFSAFTHGFLFSSIQATSSTASHNSDGIVHIEDPTVDSDNTYSVYNKQQVDALLEDYVTTNDLETNVLEFLEEHQNAILAGNNITITSSSSLLPSGYAQVEYIQSNGASYLDTGTVPTDNTKIVLDIFNNTTGSFYAIGARANSSSTILLAQSGSSTGSTVLGSFNGTSLTAKTNNTNWSRTSAGQRYLISIETNNGTGTYSVYDYNNDREFNAQISYTQLGTQTAHICVLGFNSNNVLAGTSRVYRCEIYQNTVMVFQGVPCYRISDGVYGLYDVVSNTFKTSVTSTALTGSTEIHDTLTISSKDEKAQWGKITGTLSNQTDLSTALGLKANSADLAAVATSGSYNDLSNKPTIPTVNDSTITIKKNSSDTGDSFTTNTSSGKTINLGLSTVATSGSYNDLSNKPTIPTDTSDLTNGAGYITGYTETDPTVPSWAKQDNKPTYTLDEVSDGSSRKLSNYVPTTRKVNNKALSSDITINLDDVSDGTTRKLSNYVPTTRTVNSKALSSNVTLTLDDIADGTNRSIPTVNNATLTIQKNGTTVNTFTANASSNVTANITVPTTVAELSDASNYAQASSLTSLVATAQYNSTDKTIEFYNAAGTKLNTDIDATAFIKDGMVDDVEITNGKLVISFNTDSGKEDIEIPISDIFDASNYYTKSQVDGLIPTVNNSTITIKKSSSDTGDSFTTNASLGKTINLGLHTVATSGSYNDLANKPTIPTDTSDLTNGAGYITGYTETDPTVPAWAKESSKPSYTLDEVSDGTTRKLSNYVQTTRKVNNKALSSDITLSLDDVADGSSRSIPTNVSELYNDSGYLTEHQDISGKQDVLTAGEGIAITSDTVKTTGIPFGIVDSTSTSTVYTVTVPGIYKLEDGVCCLVKNGVITSASGFTLNVNGLGAKPCYSNMAAATRETTAFNVNYTILFVYDSTRVEGGAWIYYRGYYSDANSIAYQIRGNTHTLPTTGKFVRYRLLFTSADGTHFIPSNISTSTNATAKRDVVQTPIDPFGEIVYYSTTAAVDVGASPGATYLWTQYAVTLGYSFNRTGAALVLTFPAPIYLKCAPQSNGSAIIDADNPYVQVLPNTADGKIYIFLGVATSATAIELLNNHPIYYHDGTGIRIWTGKDCYSKSEADTAFVSVARTVNSKALSSDITLNLDDVLDGSSRVIPTDTGDLTNNAGFITSAALPTVNDSTITIKKTASDSGDSFTTNNATAKTINLDLHTVATSGNYNDLSNKPTIPTVNNAKLTIKKTSTDTGTEFTANASTDVTCNLDLATVATSGSYNDLSNKPTIPTVNNSTITIKKNSDDTGDSFTTNASSGKTINLGLSAIATSGSYNDLSNKPTIPTVNDTTITIKKNTDDTGDSFTTNTATTKTINLGLSTVATSGSYNDLSNKPTIPTVNNAKLTIKKNASDAGTEFTANASTNVDCNLGLATVATSGSYNDLSNKPTIPTVNNASLTINKGGTDDTGSKTFTANASSNVTINLGLANVASSGSYNDLSNKPTIPTVNDTTITIKKNTSDTGDSFTTNAPTAKTINLGLSTVATSGSYNDLSNKPTIPTVNNATLTIQKNGTSVGTFTANASSNATANITVPLESISVDGTTQTITNRNVDLHIPADITNSELIGGFVRYDVSGSGSLTIKNTYGLFPYSGGTQTTLPAGTYLVRVRLRSTTSNYSVTVNFGTPYTVTSSGGVIDDLREVTLSSAQGFSASITSVAASTYLRVVIYEPGSVVTSVGTAATTNDYNDLDNIPNGTLVIQRNGSNVASFSASANSNVTANISVPTTVASLTDASNYVTTTNTSQTITGEKTFNTIGVSGSIKHGTNTYSLPSNNGTLALDNIYISQGTIGNGLIDSSADYRSSDGDSSPRYHGYAISIGINENVSLTNGTHISVYIPDKVYVGSIGFKISSTLYSAYPICFRGTDSQHNPSIPAGSVLSLTFYNNTFYSDFYDLADFGKEHEPIVSVGRLSTHNDDIFGGALVGIRNDDYTLDRVITVTTSSDDIPIASSYNSNILETTPVYACFWGECYSSHPHVPFGFMLSRRPYDEASITPTDSNIPFIFVRSDSSTVASHYAQNPESDTYYFHVPNAPVYILNSSYNNRCVSIGGLPTGCNGRLIGFLQQSLIDTDTHQAENAGLLRLVNNTSANYVTINTAQTITGDKTINEKDLFISDSQSTPVTDTVDAFVMKRGQEFIAGTQTSSTYSWTGKTKQSAIYDGMCINYYLPYASNGNYSATLNLTLPDNTTTGAISIIRNGAGSTYWVYNDFPRGSVIQMTLLLNRVVGGTTYEKIWMINAFYYSDSNYYDRVLTNSNVKAGTNGIKGYTLILRTGAATWESIVNSNSTGTDKTANTSGFYLDTVYYYGNSSAVSSGSFASGIYSDYSQVYASRLFNLSSALTSAAPVYLIFTYNSSNGKFYLDTTRWWTQSPTSESSTDGKYFLYIGRAYVSGSNSYTSLENNHPLFHVVGTSLVQIDDISSLPFKVYTESQSATFTTILENTVTLSGKSLILYNDYTDTSVYTASGHDNVGTFGFYANDNLFYQMTPTNVGALSIKGKYYSATDIVNDSEVSYYVKMTDITPSVISTGALLFSLPENSNSSHTDIEDGDTIVGRPVYEIAVQRNESTNVAESLAIIKNDPNGGGADASLRCGTFIGDLEGKADSATKAGILSINTDNTYPVTFADSFNNSSNNVYYKQLHIDDSSTNALKYNPSTNTCYCGKFSGTPIIPFGSASLSSNTWTVSSPSPNPTSSGYPPEGAVVSVLFGSINSVSSPQLKFGSWDARPIYRLSSYAGTTANESWSAQSTVLLRYTGGSSGQWRLLNGNCYPTSTASGTTNIIPSSANTYDLGSSSYPWRYVYISGGNSSYYAVFDNSGSEPTFRPSTSNYGYLGTSSYRWYVGAINNLLSTNALTGLLVTCSTSASQQQKDISIGGPTMLVGNSSTLGAIPFNGFRISVKFEETNSAASPTLCINGNENTTHPIVYRGTSAVTTGNYYKWQAGDIVDLVYDNSNSVYVIAGWQTYAVNASTASTCSGRCTAIYGTGNYSIQMALVLVKNTTSTKYFIQRGTSLKLNTNLSARTSPTGTASTITGLTITAWYLTRFALSSNASTISSSMSNDLRIVPTQSDASSITGITDTTPVALTGTTFYNLTDIFVLANTTVFVPVLLYRYS